MPESAGPYKTVRTNDGTDVPWYVIPFDKHGQCEAPRTRQSLLDALGQSDFTHVFVFSHGWNNDWSAASARYDEFIDGLVTLRRESGHPPPDHYRPLLVGIFWPSVSLVLPWEEGPRFAAVDQTPGGAGTDASRDDLARSIAAIAESLPGVHLDRFRELVGKGALTDDEAIELAGLLAPILAADDEVPSGGGGASDLAVAWQAGAALLRTRARASDSEDDADEEFGVSARVASRAAPRPAALGLAALDPRHAIRMATVWMMKDRAGTVGGHGVHPLVCDILERSGASVHMIGHSYGCKVVLSAVACGSIPRPVTSALLLQPAISHLAFAKDADGQGHPGGYRVALDRITQPILATFSNRDFALSRVFHLAVRRRSDLGERRIAAGPPNRFAALGGYGPGGMDGVEAHTILLKEPGDRYDELERPGLRILAANGSRRITGHGAIVQPATYWALSEQVRLSWQSGRPAAAAAE